MSESLCRLLFCWWAASCPPPLDHLLLSNAWGMFECRVRGDSSPLWLKDFWTWALFSSRIDALLSHYPSLILLAESSVFPRRVATHLLVPLRSRYFTPWAVGRWEKVFARFLVGSCPWAGKGRWPPQSLIFSVGFLHAAAAWLILRSFLLVSHWSLWPLGLKGRAVLLFFLSPEPAEVLVAKWRNSVWFTAWIMVLEPL